MEADLEKLINSTTIVKVYDNEKRQIIFGDEYSFSRYQNGQGQQADLEVLEDSWENKWKSFGNNWNEERQNYRFLYDSFKHFYLSFEQLRLNKVACINNTFGDIFKKFHYEGLIWLGLYGIYQYGKKCIDLLINVLKLIDKKDENRRFLNKFSGTRNKIIEHNYNPFGLNLQIDPSTWSLIGTDSFLKVYIHKPGKERVFEADVDYYEDYYQLEKIITDIIKEF